MTYSLLKGNKFQTTNYGLKSFKDYGAKIWNLLPDCCKGAVSLDEFKVFFLSNPWMDQNVHVRYVFALYEPDHISKHHNGFLITLLLYFELDSGVILTTLFNSTYSFTHVLIHSVCLHVWSDRKWMRYWCILLLYIWWVLWVIFYTLHFCTSYCFLSLSDNSSLVANVICWL